MHSKMTTRISKQYRIAQRVDPRRASVPQREADPESLPLAGDLEKITARDFKDRRTFESCRAQEHFLSLALKFA